ncbi:MAG: hypothetical protein N4A33_13575 [Bacteriovoracaceae bacterium]|jgi:hypothetical protein|nr:hypothetical protein [Bacteriovoracaceae bacterium]
MRLLYILLLPVLAFAIDFSAYKLKAKSILSSILPKTYIEKIFGKEQSNKTISMPVILKINKTGTDSSFYTKGLMDKKISAFDKLSVLEKRKYRIGFINDLFRSVLKAQASDAQMSSLLSRLEQNAKREGIYRSLVSNNLYMSLEENPTTASENLVNFTLSYAKKYLGKKFKKELIANSNKYTVKRIIADQTLDLIEAYSNRPDDLYAWYANFSSEISKKINWKSKLRAVDDIFFHYRWAKKNNFDHIKTEVTIKLHYLGNYL